MADGAVEMQGMSDSEKVEQAMRFMTLLHKQKRITRRLSDCAVVEGDVAGMDAATEVTAALWALHVAANKASKLIPGFEEKMVGEIQARSGDR